MADTKISALTGGTAASADQIPINRAGTNLRINAGDIAGIYEVATFANLPAAAGVTVGRVYTVLGALMTGGQVGTRWVSDGSVWRPACVQLLYATSTQVDGTAASTSEQILRQLLFPAGAFSGASRVSVWARYVSNGTSDPNSRTTRIRFGSAGTTSDTSVASVTFTNTQRQSWTSFIFAAASDTSIAPMGYAAAASGAFFSSQGVASVAPANITVSSLAAATYLSISTQQGASPVDTLGVARLFVEVA